MHSKFSHKFYISSIQYSLQKRNINCKNNSKLNPTYSASGHKTWEEKIGKPSSLSKLAGHYFNFCIKIVKYSLNYLVATCPRTI